MYFIIITLGWILIIAVLLLIFTSFYNKKKNKDVVKTLKNIDNESKLIAIDELRKLTRKNPDNYQAREKLGDFLFENKSYLPAIKEYLIILDRKSNILTEEELKLINKIGEAYLKLGSDEEAKKYFMIAKSKEDINITANLRLAEIEIKQNNYEKADIYYSIIDKVEPDNIEMLKSYAICLFNLKRYKDALTRLAKIIKAEKGDNEVYYYLGYSLYYLNRYDDSIKYFNMLKKEPGYSSESFFIIGKIHKDQNLFIKAVEDFNNALISGNFKNTQILTETHYLLADCYFKSHNLQKAVEHWQKVSDLTPGYKDVNEKLENYSNISSNQLLEMYLVGSVNQFIKICKYFVKYYIDNYSSLKGSIKFNEIKTTQDGLLEVLAEVTNKNFIETIYFVFIRSATTVGDMAMRKLYNTLKEVKADKGICATAGNFSDPAKEFVESRMIKLYERDKLVEILNKISKKLRESK